MRIVAQDFFVEGRNSSTPKLEWSGGMLPQEDF